MNVYMLKTGCNVQIKFSIPSFNNMAGITPNDVQVIELHDCFSANELITYEALGLCAPGEIGH